MNLTQLLKAAKAINPEVFTVNMEAGVFEDGDFFERYEARIPGSEFSGDTPEELLAELKEAA